MEKADEAGEILRLVAVGEFKIAEHTFNRGAERGISREQIIHCAAHCIYHKWQESQGTHIFVGFLDANASGGFSAVMRSGVIIVTVFRRRLSRWEKNLIKSKKP